MSCGNGTNATVVGGNPQQATCTYTATGYYVVVIPSMNLYSDLLFPTATNDRIILSAFLASPGNSVNAGKFQF